MAVFAPEDFTTSTKRGAAAKSTIFAVWVCDQLAHERGKKPNWTACGYFDGTKVGRYRFYGYLQHLRRSVKISVYTVLLVLIGRWGRVCGVCIYHGRSLRGNCSKIAPTTMIRVYKYFLSLQWFGAVHCRLRAAKESYTRIHKVRNGDVKGTF